MRKILEDTEDIFGSYKYETTVRLHGLNVESYDVDDVLLFTKISNEHNLYCRFLFSCTCVGLLNTLYMFLLIMLVPSLTTIVGICFGIEILLGYLIGLSLYKIAMSDSKMLNFLIKQEEKAKNNKKERVLIKG